MQRLNERAMNRFLTAALILPAFLASTGCASQTPTSAPISRASPISRADPIPLYGAANPGRLSDEIRVGDAGDVRNVTYPTITPVLPAPGTANGAAVIVSPGGAFMSLAMENEGWRVAQALADQGITAFVLKYRLNPTPLDDEAYLATFFQRMFGGGDPIDPTDAVADGVTALKLVRARSQVWNLDRNRVGMIGFSAGAIVSLTSTLNAISDDDPDTTPPAFLGYVYGPMDAVEVPANAPPLFVAIAMDDGLFGGANFSVVQSWRRAERPVELHAYQGGGHGFGAGKPGTTNALLMSEFITWLEMQGFTGDRPAAQDPT